MTPARRCVLLVEDEPDLRASLAEVIGTEDYPVGEAQNGAEALEWLRAHPQPGLVLVDLAMPVMNGWRFREQQLADPRLADIPAVAVTASRSTKQQLEHLHFQDVLYKPLDLPALFATLERFCGTPASPGGPGVAG